MCGLDRHQARLAAQRDDGSVDSPAGCLFNVYFHLLVRLLFISYIYITALHSDSIIKPMKVSLYLSKLYS